MQLIDLSQGRRALTAPLDMGAPAKPILLYLGCLHHTQDIDTQNPQFFDYMHQLRGKADVRMVMPVDQRAGFPALMQQRQDFNDGTAPPSQLAEFVYDNIFAAAVDNCPDIFDPLSCRRLEKSLQNVAVFGYSYGTSLLQQIGVVMADHLESRSSSDTTRGMRIAAICQSVKALTIGPVARPYRIDARGSTASLHYDDPHFAAADTLFTHASFVMQQDRIVQRSYGDECLQGMATSATGIEMYGTKAMRVLVDYTDHPVRRALGYRTTETGDTVPEIIESFDRTVHHPRLYTNTREQLGHLRVFPSIAIAHVFRTAMAEMLQPDVKPAAWLANIAAQVETPTKRQTLMTAFEESRLEYEVTAATARSLPDDAAGLFLKEFVEPNLWPQTYEPIPLPFRENVSGYDGEPPRLAA